MDRQWKRSWNSRRSETRSVSTGRFATSWVEPRGRALGGRAFTLHRLTGAALVLYVYVHLGVLTLVDAGQRGDGARPRAGRVDLALRGLRWPSRTPRSTSSGRPEMTLLDRSIRGKHGSRGVSEGRPEPIPYFARSRGTPPRRMLWTPESEGAP